MKKLIVQVVAVAAALTSSAVTYPVTKGDVTTLTNLLATYTSQSTVIELEAGDYDLTGIEMKAGSHLYQQHVTIRGKGATPWETRLIGDGTKRVVANLGYDGIPATIDNLTLTNGYTTSSGGGLSGYLKINNSIIIGCKAANGGAAEGSMSATNCKFINNTATVDGGALYRPSGAVDCDFIGNTAAGSGGAVYSYDKQGSLRGCLITNNVAGGSGGGVFYGGLVTNCIIVCNKATTGDGGGLYLASGKSTSDCPVRKSVIAGNYAGGDGGGAYHRDLYDCEVHDNYSLNHGGGLYTGVARHCIISNNITGVSSSGDSYLESHGWQSDNTFRTGLEYCDISGSSPKSGYGLGCTVHDVMKKFTLVGNPHAGEVSKTCSIVWAGSGALTNCLVVNNGPGVATTGVSLTLFRGSIRSIVNCTIVNNWVTKTFHYADSTSNPVVMENCILYSNKFAHYGNVIDLSEESWGTPTCKAGGVIFKNTSYGAVNAPFADANGGMSPEGIAPGYNAYRYGYNGIGANPLFDSASAYPYSLAKRSTLRKKGVVEDWMANANDIRGAGYPRVFEEKVDLGCYQSQFVTLGMTLLLR